LNIYSFGFIKLSVFYVEPENHCFQTADVWFWFNSCCLAKKTADFSRRIHGGNIISNQFKPSGENIIMRPVLANLGFVLQITGILTLVSAGIGILYGENQAVIALLVTSVAFMVCGFGFNSLCERKELGYKSSCALIVLAFIMLGIIGAIPYLYLGVFGSDADGFTDSVFESVSGYTTTGLTMIKNVETLTKSMIFYRGFTQFIGGIGIVFLLILFFYPSKALTSFGKAVGYKDITGHMRKTFLFILGIYVLYFAIFSGAFILLGHQDPLNLVSIVFSALSTGGFIPINNMSQIITSFPGNLIISLAMIMGAAGFWINYKIITRKFREVFFSEIPILILILVASTAFIQLAFNFGIFQSFFHVVSASTTTGFSYMNFSGMNEFLRLFFAGLMFVGGTSFSTAGGFKIMRLVVIIKSIPWILKRNLKASHQPFRIFRREFADIEMFSIFLLAILMIAAVLFAAMIFSFYGFGFVDSTFETVSAITTTGLSVGITNISLLPGLKWILIVLMIIGRVEIIPFLIVFSRSREVDARQKGYGRRIKPAKQGNNNLS